MLYLNYNIGLLENHYFHIVNTKYTIYCINNYDSLKDIENFYRIRINEMPEIDVINAFLVS